MIKTTIYGIAAAIAIITALNLVSDYEPAEPHIIYTADIPNLQCPLEGACDNPNHQ